MPARPSPRTGTAPAKGAAGQAHGVDAGSVQSGAFGGASYRDSRWFGALAVMLLVGARPSELDETRLHYGLHPAARIEGGKLRG